MKLERIRSHRRHKRWVEGIFSKNPVLMGGLALPFAVMITTSLKNSVAISILLTCSLIPTVLLASLIGSKLPRWLSMMVCVLFSMGVVVACVPIINPISREIVSSLGVYVPILAVNTIQSALCLRYMQETRRPWMAFVDAVTYSIGFAVALCMIGSVRELLGSGTLWSVPVALPFRASGLLIAFAGFILVALFSAVFRFLGRLYAATLYRRDNPALSKNDAPLAL